MTRTIGLNLLNVDTFYKGSSARDRGPQNLEIWLGGTGKATADTVKGHSTAPKETVDGSDVF